MQTILVTGSNGLLGQKITEKVLENNAFRLIATNRGKNRFPIHEGYIYEEMDLLDSDRVCQVLKQYKPQAIIHTAAITNVDTCHERQEDCWKMNVEATRFLKEYCEELDIHLIYLSTDFVFDGFNGPYREEDLPNPISVYGKSKLAAEQVVQQKKDKWTIVRTILVYGILKDMSRSNIILWAKNALEKKQAIKVVDDQWRMPTLAEDLAWACLQIARLKATGIYHISGADNMSIAQLVNKVADYWSLDKTLITEVSSVTLAQEARRPIKTGFILDKAIKDLNYKAHSFDEGLKLVNQQIKAFYEH